MTPGRLLEFAVLWTDDCDLRVDVYVPNTRIVIGISVNDSCLINEFISRFPNISIALAAAATLKMDLRQLRKRAVYSANDNHGRGLVYVLDLGVVVLVTVDSSGFLHKLFCGFTSSHVCTGFPKDGTIYQCNARTARLECAEGKRECSLL
jgi:hypothetical protein